jgi:murein DD-endopeptidase MepM/ murein hydrolase activator NlpD
MGDYMDIEDYLKNRHRNKRFKGYSKSKNKIISNIFTKILISIILILLVCIYIKVDNKGTANIKKYLFNDSLKFTKINNLFNDKIGKIIPEVKNNDTNMVFNSNELKNKNYSKYYDGIKLNIDKNNPISALYGGLVVFIGNKDNYNNTIIIQGNNGIDYWYGNITNTNVNLYDYIEKDTIIGESSDNYIYIVLEKDGKYLNYDEYY